MTAYFEVTLKPNQNRDRFWDVFAKYLQRYIPEDSLVLDIGAGRCEFINRIKANSKYAYDREDISKFAAKDVHVQTSSRRMATGSYDIIFMSNFLEHLDIDEIKVLLRTIKCRKVIIFGPNYRQAYNWYWDDPTHKTALSHITVQRLLEEAGFEIEEVHEKMAPYSAEGSDWLIPRFMIWLYLRSPFKPWAGQMLITARRR